MESLKPQPGSTIDPKDAVGRGRTTERARREIRNGNNLALNDPRRMGKTVWIDLFAADPGPGPKAVKVDYEGIRSSEEFLLRTVAALRGHTSVTEKSRKRLAAMFDGLDEIGAGPISIRPGISSKSATKLLTDTIEAVADHLPEDELLIVLMDEVPLAIGNVADHEGADEANALLQALREARQSERRLRWVLTGSVGFHHVLRKCKATDGAVNDLVNLPLGPLEESEARELATRLLLGIGRDGDQGAIDALVQHSGSIPFLVHLLTHQLEDAGTGVATPGDVTEAFDVLLRDLDASKALTHLLSRVDLHYGPDNAAAEAVLNRLALSGPQPMDDIDTGGLVERSANELVDDLIRDHYLVENADGIGWRYDVLRIIWIKRKRLT